MTLHTSDSRRDGWSRPWSRGRAARRPQSFPPGCGEHTPPKRPTPGMLGEHLALGWHWPPTCDSCTLCHRLSPPLAGRAQEPTSQPWASPPDETGAAPLGGSGWTSRAGEAAPSPMPRPKLRPHAGTEPRRPRATGATAGHRAPGGRTGWQGPFPLRSWCRTVPRLHSGLLGLGQDRSPIGQRGPNPEPAVSVPPAPSLLPGSPPLPPNSEPLNPTLCRCRLEPVREALRVSGEPVKRPPL